MYIVFMLKSACVAHTVCTYVGVHCVCWPLSVCLSVCAVTIAEY